MIGPVVLERVFAVCCCLVWTAVVSVIRQERARSVISSIGIPLMRDCRVCVMYVVKLEFARVCLRGVGVCGWCERLASVCP